MAPMAVFESARSWLLYTNMASLWGDPNELAWLMRGGSLRAQVSANIRSTSVTTWRSRSASTSTCASA